MLQYCTLRGRMKIPPRTAAVFTNHSNILGGDPMNTRSYTVVQRVALKIKYTHPTYISTFSVP